jgi:hypothetical protein
VRPSCLPAVEDRRGDTEAAVAPRGSEGTGASERLTIEQYRMMIREADQARDDAMEAQNLAEAARTRAAAATQSEQGRREMMERIRHLETLVCGGPRLRRPRGRGEGSGRLVASVAVRGSPITRLLGTRGVRLRDRRRDIRLEAPDVERRVKAHRGRNV